MRANSMQNGRHTTCPAEPSDHSHHTPQLDTQAVDKINGTAEAEWSVCCGLILTTTTIFATVLRYSAHTTTIRSHSHHLCNKGLHSIDSMPQHYPTPVKARLRGRCGRQEEAICAARTLVFEWRHHGEGSAVYRDNAGGRLPISPTS